MIKIIEGKRYNTETATSVASWGNTLSESDFSFVKEELFRTKKGSWFLHGRGGGLSQYAERVDRNSTCKGENIVVFSPDEARAWLEAHDCIEALEEHFSDSIEDA